MEDYEQLSVKPLHGPLTSTVSARPEQENLPGGPVTQKRSIRASIKRLSWRYLLIAVLIIALLFVVIAVSVYFGKRSNTEEDGRCLPSAPRVKLDYIHHPDFVALTVFFWPWTPVFKNTNSPMYEDTISKAEYWVTKIFQTSSISSCIRSVATEMMGLGDNILVQFKLYVSCDSAGEIEINRAYIEGHSILQRTQDKSCVVSIGKNIYLEKLRKGSNITDLVPPAAISKTICGQSQLYPVPKIMGGRPVKRGQYPWVVKLEIEKDANQMQICGGTIWDYNHILTAAHCIDMKNSITGMVDLQAIIVTAGSVEHESNLFPYKQQRRVKSAQIHRDFYLCNENRKGCGNDIALLKLAKPLHPTQLVMKVCHPDASTQLPKKGIVAGWGQTKVEQDMEIREMQHSLELALLNQRDCKKLLRFNGLMNDLPNGTICTIDDDLEERDSCGEDDGGPLFANLQHRGAQRYTILGVYSYTYGCGKAPAVHSWVPYYLDWIKNTIKHWNYL